MSNDNPPAPTAIVAGLITTIVGGLIVAFLAGEGRFASSKPASTNPSPTDPIAGYWTGIETTNNSRGTFQFELFIQTGCTTSNLCGTYSAPEVPCSGNLILAEIRGDMFVFQEQFVKGLESCPIGNYEYIRLLPEGTLSVSTSGTGSASGILSRP